MKEETVKRIGEVSFYCFVVYMIIAIIYNILLSMNRPSDPWEQLGYDFKMFYIMVITIAVPMFIALNIVRFWRIKPFNCR